MSPVLLTAPGAVSPRHLLGQSPLHLTISTDDQHVVASSGVRVHVLARRVAHAIGMTPLEPLHPRWVEDLLGRTGLVDLDDSGAVSGTVVLVGHGRAADRADIVRGNGFLVEV